MSGLVLTEIDRNLWAVFGQFSPNSVQRKIKVVKMAHNGGWQHILWTAGSA